MARPKGSQIAVNEKPTRGFTLTRNELLKMRGHHGFGYWHLACAGCKRQFTEFDVGEKVVSVPRRNRPRLYFHQECFNKKNASHTQQEKERTLKDSTQPST